MLASCGLRDNAPMVIKIGVIAPFEGVGREFGYGILQAVNDELAPVNRERSMGRYRVAVVALNDDLDPEAAAAQAKALVRDPDVLAVIGPWSEVTALSALPILNEAGIPAVLASSSREVGGAAFVCPAVDRVAAELLRKAHESDVPALVVTGPENTLLRTLLAGAPEASKVPESAPHPCPAKASNRCLVIHTGDASGAADALGRWRAAGWEGPFLGGPEMARPWFIGRAGDGSQGARAVVCANANLPMPGPDASLRAAVGQASAATRSILSGLSQAIDDTGRPTRASVRDSLSPLTVDMDLMWLEVKDQDWVPLHE
jgi:hypothetical protein